MQTKEVKNKLKNGLYVVSTPIGNLRDISLRAIDVLKKSHLILCEDTRVSKKLLNTYDINSSLISYHKFNETEKLHKIIKELKSDKIVSLISDAGTPAISDPGKILIKACIKNDIIVLPIPGASAVSTSISISGFSDKYYFYGFLPEKKSQIVKEVKKLSSFENSIIFFISSKKINKILDPFIDYFSDREIVICKEITKIYEHFYRLKIKDFKKFDISLKGEITIVVSQKLFKAKNLEILNESDKVKIKKLINKLSVKDIVNIICENKNIPKKIVYDFCLNLKK
jgi:16S rRNA (cytidine1402-2'-O)-methyltransferase